MANNLPAHYGTLNPVWRNPASDYFSLSQTRQGDHCGFFERNFYRCMEAYGSKLGRKYCDLEHRDFNECATQDKQKKRHEAIQAQWEKLYREGKVDKKFSDHIKPGEHVPDWFSYNRIF